jgi:hypothetical protein
MKIALMDIKRQHEEHADEYEKAALDVLRSGMYIMGENVKEFEKEFASYCGVKHAIGVGNGTDALNIALRALGIGQGDEVITCPFTFFAKIQSKEQTIEQMFSNVSDGFIDDDTNTMITSETTIYLLSICVGVSIFATNTQFKAQYNSLEFLAEKCKGKKKKRLSKMANKSKHTGEIIFNYRDLNIFNEAVAAKIIGIGQELKYRHIRAAYTRTQRFGPGRKFVKTIDIKQTIVRPDLPVRI